MIGRVKSLFQRKSQEDLPPPEAAFAAPAAEVEVLDPLTQFTRNLHAMKQRDPNVRDHLYVISLADFRNAVGDKWPKLSSKVGRLGQNVVGRHVSRDGMFCQADELTFVVALPQEPRERARARVTKIAQDLSSYLLGDAHIHGERPLILAANLPFDQGVGRNGRFDSEAIAAAVSEARPMAVAATRKEEMALGSLEVFHVGQAAEKAPLEPLETLPEPKRKFISGNDEAPAPDPEWQKFTTRKAAGSLKFPWDDPGPLSSDTRLSLVWRPIWLAGTETIGAYAARIMRFEGAGKAPIEGTHAYPHRHIHDCLNIDRFVLNQFARQAQIANILTPAPMMVVPVNWACLDSPNRRALFGPVIDLPRSVKRERLQVEITHLTEAPDQRRLMDGLHFLNEIGVGVMIRARLCNVMWLINAQMVNKLVLDLAELAPEERIGDAPLLAKISGLRAMAMAKGAAFGLWGARRRNVIAALVKDGFSYVAGPGLMGDQNQVRPLIPLAKANLLRAPQQG